jgi:hypothetical protein
VFVPACQLDLRMLLHRPLDGKLYEQRLILMRLEKKVDDHLEKVRNSIGKKEKLLSCSAYAFHSLFFTTFILPCLLFSTNIINSWLFHIVFDLRFRFLPIFLFKVIKPSKSWKRSQEWNQKGSGTLPSGTGSFDHTTLYLKKWSRGRVWKTRGACGILTRKATGN